MSIKATVIALLASFNMAAATPENNAVPTPVTHQDQREVYGPETFYDDRDNLAKRKAVYQCEDGTQSCWTREEKTAAVAIEAKIFLMVGALKCSHDKKWDIPKEYNRFVTLHEKALKDFEATAISHFVRQTPENPKKGDRSYDKFVTDLANLHSAASDTHPAYCANVSHKFMKAREISPSVGIVDFSYWLTGHNQLGPLK